MDSFIESVYILVIEVMLNAPFTYEASSELRFS